MRLRCSTRRRSLQRVRLSERARRLQRDPLPWTAKVMTWTLMLAVTFLMTTKPPAWGCAIALVIASLACAIAAVPIWRQPATHLAAPNSRAQVQGAGCR